MSSEEHSSGRSNGSGPSQSHSSGRSYRSGSSARSRRSTRHAFTPPAPRPDASTSRPPRATTASTQHGWLPLPDPLFAYRMLIESLATALPHLDKIRRTARGESASVSCFDVADDGIISHDFDEYNLIDEGSDGASGSLSDLLETEPENGVTVRIISVEDLTQTVIEVLGSSLDLSPEFFEEHLLDSGWSDGNVSDSAADVWPTSHFAKNHVSLRWPRPVRMLDQPFTSDEARESMLDRESDVYKWQQLVRLRQGKTQLIHPVGHQTKALSNILRPAWPLNTLYGKRHKYEKSHSQRGKGPKMLNHSPAAWDERVSICKLDRAGYSIVVILFDPLPLVNHWTKGSDEALQKVNFDPPMKLATLQDSIWIKGQRSWEFTVEKAQEMSRHLIRSSSLIKISALTIEMGMPDYPSPGSSPAPTQSPPDEDLLGTGYLIYDGLQRVSFEDRNIFQRNEQRREARARLQRRKAKQNYWEQVFGKGATQQLKATDEESALSALSGSRYDMGKGVKSIVAGPLTQCMFENWSPRYPVTSQDFMKPSSLTKSVDLLSIFSAASSTASDFGDWIYQAQTPAFQAETPIEILLRIICTDVNEYADLVSLTLNDISQKMLDDILIQQQLFHWQSLLERIEYQCRTTHTSILQFIGFLLPNLHIGPTSGIQRPISQDTAIEHLAQQTLSKLDAIREHVRRTGDSLMANMNLLESEKSIAEAESVGKLTELAFVFIPLSFAASVFGMQVKELDPSSTSIAAFFVLAIVSLVLLYTARLIVRSESVRAYRYQLLSNFRASAGLVGRDPVPFVTFVSYTIVQLIRSATRFFVTSGSLVALVGAGIALIMLVPVWLSALDSGLKTAITIPLVLISAVIVMGWSVLSVRKHIENRAPNDKQSMTDD